MVGSTYGTLTPSQVMQDHLKEFVKVCQQLYPVSHPDYDNMALACRNVANGTATARGSHSNPNSRESLHQVSTRGGHENANFPNF